VATEDTKERLIDAAEALFAQQGYAATSLRSITSSAGANLAAVNYHFGSKVSLLLAVLERRLKPINDERLRMLDALEKKAGGEPVAIEKLLEALFAPPLRLSVFWDEGGAMFLKLAERVHSESEEEILKLFFDQFKEIFERFFPAFRKALPDLPHEELVLRLWFMKGAMLEAINWGKESKFFIEEISIHPDRETILANLLQFTAAGMRAPLPGKGDQS
jgi:AcrR family transcriptional regulator